METTNLEKKCVTDFAVCKSIARHLQKTERLQDRQQAYQILLEKKEVNLYSQKHLEYVH